MSTIGLYTSYTYAILCKTLYFRNIRTILEEKGELSSASVCLTDLEI